MKTEYRQTVSDRELKRIGGRVILVRLPPAEAADLTAMASRGHVNEFVCRLIRDEAKRVSD